MRTEVFQRNERENQYYQEMEMAKKAGIFSLLKKIIREKGVSFKESSGYKYFLEVTWPIKKDIFENVITIVPDLKREVFFISGSSCRELKKEEWIDKKRLEKELKKIYKKPAIRSNIPFHNN